MFSCVTSRETIRHSPREKQQIPETLILATKRFVPRRCEAKACEVGETN